MKKYLALVLAVLMLAAAFAGCAPKDTTTGGGTQGGQQSGDQGSGNQGGSQGGQQSGGQGSGNQGGTTPDTPDTPAKPEPSGTFRTYFTNPPPTVSVLDTGDTNPHTLIDLTSISMYRTVLNEEKTGWKWTTDLAADFPTKVDADGYVWKYTILETAVWSNGDKVTVDDVEFTLKEFADPVRQHGQKSQIVTNSYGVLKNIYEYSMGEKEWSEVGYKKIDDYNFEITYTTPCTMDDAVRAVDRALVNKTVFEKGLNEDKSASVYGTSLDYYASAGAFILSEWIPDGKYVLTRNPDYVHADEILLQEMVYTVVPDTNAALQLFEKGELDYCSLSYTQWEKFEEDPRIYEYFNDSLMYFMINHGNPSFGNILGNLNFRKALFHGVDRQALADTIGCYPATRLIRRAVMTNPATGVPFYTLPTDYVKTADEVFDKTLANQLLDKAYEECGQTKVDMRILFSETSTHLRGCAEILQKQYHDFFGGKLNVIMHTMPSAQAQALRKWNPDNPTGFDTALGSFLPSANDPRQTFKFYLSNVQPPRFFWTSDELDELFADSMELDLETQNEEVIEYCKKMEKLMLDEMVIVPVYEIPTKVLYETNVQLPADGYVIGWGFGNQYMTMAD